MKTEKNANRILELLDIALKEDIQYHGYDYFDDVFLIHNTLPASDFEEIDLSTKFLNKSLNLPIIFAPITGGNDQLVKVNEALADVAKHYNIGIGVGDQIYGLKNQKINSSYSIVRKKHPDGLIFGNLSYEELINPNFTIEQFQYLVESIKADAIEIYLNPLQQLFWNEKVIGIRNLFERIKEFNQTQICPIIMRSMGAGMANDEVQKLWKLGIAGIDLVGMGGTSFARMFTLKNMTLTQKQSLEPQIEPFDFWGIPTLWSLMDVVLRPENKAIPVIAGGGIKNGIQAIKALALGAKVISVGYPVLIELIEDFGHPDEKNLISWMEKFIVEMKMTMYLLGAKNIAELQQMAKERIVFFNRTKAWMKIRGLQFS